MSETMHELSRPLGTSVARESRAIQKPCTCKLKRARTSTIESAIVLLQRDADNKEQVNKTSQGILTAEQSI